MYLKIDLTDYTNLRNLVFSPQTDITADTLPVNEFSVDVIADSVITMGQYAELYDDLNTLWAKYWITYAERVVDGIIRVKAQSPIGMMDGVTLPAVVYENTPLETVLNNTIVRHAGAGLVATLPYSFPNSFFNVRITGVCPEQSARERLQWVCFVIGAYVKSYFNTLIEILPISESIESIPFEKTFWKPTVNYSNVVTGLEITAYSFEKGEPGVGDEYVEVGNDTYIATTQKITISNESAASSAADNIIKIEGVYLINADNVSSVISRIVGYMFKRTTVELDTINNGEYIPGERRTVYADSDTVFGGHITSCAFSFGKQARSRIKLVGADDVETANLTVLCKYGNKQINKKVYALPVGYMYYVQNLYIDTVLNDHRYVFRPTSEAITGTLLRDTTVTAQYEVALDLYDGTLHVVNVDKIEVKTEGADTVGVIS